MKPLIITGTDTGIGKTVIAAMLAQALGALYWKPIQAGRAERTDRETVLALSGIVPERALPERHLLNNPLSPHRAAELDKFTIDVGSLHFPSHIAAHEILLIEGAGGLLVPLNRATLQIELFARWDVPVLLCARTTLGTINHTLLSVEALQRRKIPLLGIVFIGDSNPDNERTILDFSHAKRLGRLPWLEELSPAALREAFDSHFEKRDFPHA